MHCPFCPAEDTRVVDSRVVEDGAAVRRRRECEACGRRFSTFERAEVRLPMVVKKDGTREAFDPDKVRSGMRKALEKRPVSAEAVESALAGVVRAVRETNEAEIPASVVGELVMGALRRLDGVAYVRFASVYREFKDVDEFLSAVQAAVKGR
ncbi:MAG: transcriptional repressor NrdR [Zetaproteobacteria bacterium]|nr:MAG: transcriptional repressor NrdR [Zetaproteobacteria bacterium]